MREFLAAIAISVVIALLVPMVGMPPFGITISGPPTLHPIIILVGAAAAFVALGWVVVKGSMIMSGDGQRRSNDDGAQPEHTQPVA